MSKLERKTDLSCTENHISAVKSSTNIKEKPIGSAETNRVGRVSRNKQLVHV